MESTSTPYTPCRPRSRAGAGAATNTTSTATSARYALWDATRSTSTTTPHDGVDGADHARDHAGAEHLPNNAAVIR